MKLLRCLTLLLLALAIALTTPARASDLAAEADLHFRLGAQAYQRGDYPEALDHFLVSNRLVPNRNVVFNIARTYERLGEHPEAYHYYAIALEAESEPDSRGRIEEALARVLPHVAVLHVETQPPGATIYIARRDLGPRGTSPRQLGLEPGNYRVIAELPGYYPGTASVELPAAGVERHVQLTLTQILGRVRIEGTSGMDVRVGTPNAPVVCQSPCTLELAPGTQQLLLSRAGFHGRQLTVEVRADSTRLVEPLLEPLTGTVVVSTDEPGALVEVDGRPQGFSPAILTLTVGEHWLRLSRQGFRPREQRLAVTHGTQQRVDVELTQRDEIEAASRAQERIEDAPSSVSVIPRLELRAFAYPTLAEAVRGLPGVSVWDDQHYVALGVRGLGRLGGYTNRLLLLQDGIPTNDNWIGSAYVGYDGSVDLADVDRIEVVRGPGSALYGTGAFSGVINVVSRREARSGLEGGVSTNLDGVARGRVRADLVLSPDSGAWISAASARGEGRDFFFPELAQQTPPEGPAGTAHGVDGFEASTVRGRSWWRWLSLQGFYHRYDKQLPAAAYETLLGDPRARQVDTRSAAELRAEPRLSREVSTLSRIHFNQYQFRGIYPRPVGEGGLEVDTYRGRWVTFEQRVTVQPSQSWRLTAGAEGQLHYLVEQRGRDEEGYFLDHSGADAKPYQVGAAYAVADGDAADWLRLSLGARLDAYSTFGSSLNPRAGVILRPYDGGNTKLLGGRAFRAPSTYELYYNDGGYTQIESPDLQPETITSIEVEHSHRFSPTVSAQLGAYGNYVRDLVDSGGSGAATDPIYYFNADSPLLVLGTELGLRRDWRQGWMLAASYGLSRARFLASNDAADLWSLERDPTRRNVQNAPVHSGTFKGAVPIIDRHLTAATRLTAESKRWDRSESVSDPPQRRTDAFVLWDLVLTGHEDRWDLDYALGVYNLFDWRYSLPVSDEFTQRTMPQRGRTVLASVDFRL